MIYIDKARDGVCASCEQTDDLLWLAAGDTEITLCEDCADTLATMIRDEVTQ